MSLEQKKQVRLKLNELDREQVKTTDKLSELEAYFRSKKQYKKAAEVKGIIETLRSNLNQRVEVGWKLIEELNDRS